MTLLEGTVSKVEYRYGDLEALVVERVEDTGGFEARTINIPYSVVSNLASGTIVNTLYGSAINAGVDPQIIVSLSDVFAWDIDFATDIREGDSFRILYETIVAEGRSVGASKILAAEIVNDGKKFTAVYYEGKGIKNGYFDPEGRSVSRQLLKSPIRYRRISSYFTNRRYHPILKKYRPHHGVDYAAPKGTPVEAAGGGRVVYAGWKSGYGNVVTIRHNGTYTTTYGHLSRLARNIRKGKRVEQAQVVGYVGSTGLSTGPHLHYEVKVNGRLVNPLSIKPRPSRSLNGEDLERFKDVRDGVLARLYGSENTQVAEEGEHRLTIN